MKSYNYNLGHAFYNIAEQYPDRNAIIYEDNKSVTFRSLNKLSNQIAQNFLEQNITSGSVVGIFHNKTVYGYAVMIACLKIGAIYVNLDYKSPLERLLKILNTCKPKIIFNDFENDAQYFSEIETPIQNIHEEEFLKKITEYKSENISVTDSVCSSDPTYIMFTSGSTGFPKGATMTHQNILNFIAWGKERYEVSIEDRFTNVNPMYFDNSVFDFYTSIFNGASLIPFDYEDSRNPVTVREKVTRLGATIWFSVPSMLIYLLTMKVLREEDFTTLRIISFGGEGFPKPKLKKLYDLYSNRIKFINVYGPTECTCICSAYDISDKDFEDMINLTTLGKLAPNFKYIILKNNESDFGELCLIGPQVGLGYYNDFERTSQSFIQNPENKVSREIIYKTGDLVCEDEFGMLHFKGRKDNQIKHMGYRIELEEIEAAFNSIPSVGESAVVYKKSNGEIGTILAFVSAQTETTEQNLFASVKTKLPQYMIPKTIKILNQLPKNKNGKTDKIRLLEEF